MSIIGEIRDTLSADGIFEIKDDDPKAEQYKRALWSLKRKGWVIEEERIGNVLFLRYRGQQEEPPAPVRRKRKKRSATYPTLGSHLRVTVIGEDGKGGGYFLSLMDETGKAWTAHIEG